MWLVDPIDGTSSFVAGSDDFAIMVALVECGETVASWIYRPTRDSMYQVERGAGASRDGEKLVLGMPPKALSELRGPALTRFLPTVERQPSSRVARASRTRVLATPPPASSTR